MQAGAGLLVSDVMPIYMIIFLNIVITMHFSINCPTVICLPTVCYVFEREASSENYGPRVYLKYKKKLKIYPLNFICFYFIFQFIYLPLQDLILASNEFKGSDDPLSRVGCKYCFRVCRCCSRGFV